MNHLGNTSTQVMSYTPWTKINKDVDKGKENACVWSNGVCNACRKFAESWVKKKASQMMLNDKEVLSRDYMEKETA